MKKDDIFEIYNDMEQMLNSIDLDKKESNVPEMPKILTNLYEMNKETVEDKIEEIDTLDEELENKLNILSEIKIEENKIINQLEEKLQNKKIELDFVNNVEEQNKEEKQNNIDEEIKENKKDKKKNKKNKIKKWVITFSIFDIIALTCLFLMYGPISYFRNLWVTSAMTTMNHKYLAYIFFSPSQVETIMANNVVIESEEDTNVDEIEIKQEPEEEIIEYSSIYEEQVLKRDEGNNLYKVIKLEGDGYKGHMLVVYDPSKIKLARITNLKYGKTIEQFAQINNAVAGINAGGFYYSSTSGYTPVGTLIQDGKLISDIGTTGWGGGVVGFTYDNILVLTKASATEALNMGVRDAVSFGPFLIVNGVPSEFKGNGGYGIAPRTAIGQRKDGIVLMVVIDGRRPGHSIGVDMKELTNIFINYGAYNASNLDGGGSSTLMVDGKTLSIAGGYGYTGDRYLPNSWLVIQ